MTSISPNDSLSKRTDRVTRVYDRRTGSLVEERVLGDALMRLAYLGPGRALFSLLFFRTAWFSRLLGRYADCRCSRRRIAGTVRDLGIDMSECRDPLESFRTFNEFFYRRLKDGARPFDPDPAVLCSPADCRISVFPRLAGDTCVPVKGKEYTLSALFGPAKAERATAFSGGSLAVCRLCPADYHRFHYPGAGTTVERWEVDGRLHSVHPLVLGLGIPVFVENRRVVSLLRLVNLGPTAFVEVGAFGVGGMVQTHVETSFRKMAEKGYFRFGGSTIILVFEEDAVRFDEDLREQSAAGLETLVKAGERIGGMTPRAEPQCDGLRPDAAVR